MLRPTRAAAVIAATCIALFGQIATAPQARGAGIPDAIRHRYLAATRDVRLAIDPARLPFSGTDWYGHNRAPYFRTYVNGRGPFTFLFDTGSTTTILSSKVVRAAGVQIVSRVPGHHAIARADLLRSGPATMRDVYCVIADGNDVDGILGFNAFGGDFLTFDFVRRALIVSTHPLPLSGAFWLRYTLAIARIPVIDLFVGKKRLPTLIDTGDDAYAWEATPDDLRGLLFDHTPELAATVFNGETGATQTTITTIDGTLRLGPLSATRPAVAINPALPVADIGIDTIGQFDLEFDRVHERVGFRPHVPGPTFHVPGTRTPGFYLSFRSVPRRVRSALPGMAPARAGMRAGDALIAINGRRADRIAFATWDRLVRGRKSLTVTFARSGHAVTRTFPVVELR